MKRFSLITTSLMLAIITGLACACHKPSEPSVSTSSSTFQTTTSSEVTSSTTALTETVPTTASETTGGSVTETTPSYIATERGTYVEDRHVAKGKFNYVLKNKDWKFDGEMYYHKYKDGTTVYYDKEAKSWFVMDNKGQGWYYDSEIDDFVRDE